MVAGIVATRARSSSRDTSAAESALRKLQWGFPVAVNGAERNCRAFRFAKVDAACGSSDRTEQTAAANVLRMATASVGIDTSRVKRRVDALVDLWYARDDGAALSRAVQTMRSILASDSTSATAWTDLSAALLMQYAITGNNESLLQGFNAACEAHQLDPKSTDALWNRAVAETWLGLRDESERAWLEYKHVSLNEAPIVDYAKDPLRLTPHAVAISGAWREASRKYLWRVVLPAWGSATLSGNLNGVAQALREIDSLVATSTDTDPADSPRAIRDMLLGVDNTRERQEIARGVIALRDYRDAFEQSNLIVASAALKRAQSEPAFEHRFSLWTRYETANVLLVSLKPDSSRKLLTAIAADAVHARPAVSRLARLSLALGRVSGDRQSNAVDEFLALIPLCEQMSDEDCVIAAQGMLGASYILLGDSKRAIDALIVATINSAGAPETTRRWTALNQLRLVASTQNMTGAVAEIDAEMEPLARRLKRVSLQLNSAKQRAELVLGRGSVRDAEAAVDQFVQLYRDRANDSQRMEFRGDWLALRGKLALREHRPDGIVLLDSAVADATKSGNRVRRQPMVYALARAKAEHGDTIAALGDLSVLLAELRERVGSKSSVFELTRLAELNRGASTLAATLQLRRHDARGALNALSDRDFNTPYVHDERPEVVSLAVRELGDSTVVWYVSHDSLRVRVLDTRVREVRRMVLQFDSTSLTGLYAALLEPWLAKHGTSGAPGIRLDVRGAMTAVPWAALRSAKTGKYVAESYELRGVSDAFGGARVPDASGLAGASVLIVDAAPRAGVGALPGAMREVKSLQQLWSGQASTVSATVGVSAILRAIDGASIVHFAGHSRVDETVAERSALLLQTGDADSLVFASTIATWRLPRVKLLILSSCDSRVGGATPSGGFDSLAGVLLSDGVQSVIGAAWPVDDDATVDLMKALHRQLRAGASAGGALQRAQLQLIHSSDPTRNSPRVWAAFQLLGR